MFNALLATDSNPRGAEDFALTHMLRVFQSGKGQQYAPVPLFCSECGEFQPLEATNITRKKISFVCPNRHHTEKYLPVTQENIQASYSRSNIPMTDERAVSIVQRHFPQWWKWLASFRPSNIPPGFTSPKLAFQLTLPYGYKWIVHYNMENRRTLLVLAQVRKRPFYVYVSQDWMNNVLSRPTPDDPLSFPLSDHPKSGLVFFPHVTFGNRYLSYFFFRVLEPGWHQIEDQPEGYYTPVRKLMLIIPCPQTREHFTVEITLNGSLHNLKFHYPNRSIKKDDQLPFVMLCISLWLHIQKDLLSHTNSREQAIFLQNHTGMQVYSLPSNQQVFRQEPFHDTPKK